MERTLIISRRRRSSFGLLLVGTTTTALLLLLLLAPTLTTASTTAWRKSLPRQKFPLFAFRHHALTTPPSIVDVRGGSDSNDEDEDGDESSSSSLKKPSSRQEDFGDEDEYDESEEESLEVEEPGENEEEEEEFEDDGYVQVDHEDDLLDEEEDDESEEAYVVDVVEETTTIEETKVIAEEMLQDEDENKLNDDDEEEDVAVAIPRAASSSDLTTHDDLERATAAGFHTDDENSSAFVDRMELADAYDLEEETVADEVSAVVVEDAKAMAAVMAATAVGAGGSDPGETINLIPEPSEEDVATEVAESENVPTITDDMKSILVKQLKFKPSDLKVLRPDIAAMVVANKLQKPDEGMPPNWYVPTAARVAVQKSVPTNDDQSRKGLVVKVSVTAATILAATLLIVKGQDMGMLDLDDIQEALFKIPAALAAIPSVIASSLGKDKASKTPYRDEKGLVEVQSPPLGETEEEEKDSNKEELDEEMDNHPHSVKPGASKAPAYEQDLDKTWLDKGITKMENAIKAFFRIKI